MLSVPRHPDDRRFASLQDLVNDVNAWPLNDTLEVAFTADVNNPNAVSDRP